MPPRAAPCRPKPAWTRATGTSSSSAPSATPVAIPAAGWSPPAASDDQASSTASSDQLPARAPASCAGTPSAQLRKVPMSEQHEFDLIVVGSGAAGLSAALRAAELGARVAVLTAGPVLAGSSL